MTINEVTQAGVKKVAAVAIDSNGNVVEGEHSGQPHNRYQEVPDNTSIPSMLWAEGEDVRSIRFLVRAGVGGATGDVIKVCYDPTPVDNSTDTTVAAAWLTTAAAHESATVQYDQLVAYAPTAVTADSWSEWRDLTFPLRRVAFQAVPNGAYTIFAETK